MKKSKTTKDLKGLLAVRPENASAVIGLDSAEMRDTVKTLYTQDPKAYMQFRNAVLYGHKLEDTNPMKHLMKKDIFNIDIKSNLTSSYNKLLDQLSKNTPTNRATFNANPLSAFLPPYDTIINLPMSERRSMAFDAFEQAYQSKKKIFNNLYPPHFQAKTYDDDGFKIQTGSKKPDPKVGKSRRKRK